MRIVPLAGTGCFIVLAIALARPGIAQPQSRSEPAATVIDPIQIGDGDWPCWRGLKLDGKSRGTGAPTRWSRTENVLWQTEVPGRGHASPVVVGDFVFLAAADDATSRQLLLAYDRDSGRELWSTAVHTGPFMRMHPKNSHASATPACDGARVYTAFIHAGALHVSAIDLAGKIVWQTEAGSFGSEHGYGSSPVLHGPHVIVLGDNTTSSFVAALDRQTGKVVWRTDRKTTGRHGSYATPVVAQFAGKTQLLVSGMESTSSYEPATGKLIWTCAGPAEVTACTLAFDDQMVFSSGGYPEKELMAIRANGSGDVTRSHVAWRTGKGVTYVPSPLVHAGRLYVVSDNGITTCFETASGRQIWQGRLEGNFSASPVWAAGLIFVTNEAGKTFVIKTGDRFEIVAENDLGDGGFASPVICGDTVYLRTRSRLYCIAAPAAAAAR